MAYLHQNKIMEINKKDILSLTTEEKAVDFMVWVKSEAPVIRFPWGDKGYTLEGFIVSQEDFEAQKQMFPNCSLEYQNWIYELKKLCEASKADLVFKF